MLRLFFGFFLLFSLYACSNSESVFDAVQNRPGIANITLVASINGIGDNSYNDQILAGLFRFNEDSGVPFRLLQPESMDEADSLVKAWLKENVDKYIVDLTPTYPDAPSNIIVGGVCWEHLKQAIEEEQI